jgi:hypothetical protein
MMVKRLIFTVVLLIRAAGIMIRFSMPLLIEKTKNERQIQSLIHFVWMMKTSQTTTGQATD